jgi:hypothetical protein
VVAYGWAQRAASHAQLINDTRARTRGAGWRAPHVLHAQPHPHPHTHGHTDPPPPPTPTYTITQTHTSAHTLMGLRKNWFRNVEPSFL